MTALLASQIPTWYTRYTLKAHLEAHASRLDAENFVQRSLHIMPTCSSVCSATCSTVNLNMVVCRHSNSVP